jgi:hypothetical protein
MIELRDGERIVKAFEVKKSPHGQGLFYITNFGVYLETQKNGLVLDLPFEVLKSFKDTGKDSFRIDWEQDGRRLYYEFKVKVFSKEIFDAYATTNKAFSCSV